MAESDRTLPPAPAPGPAVDPYVATWVRIIRAIDARECTDAAEREDTSDDGRVADVEETA